MRKFWFAYLAKALVVFPGGFGTLDELMEILTLSQTQKLAKKMTVVLYGSKYWKEIINFDALVKYGMISPEDLNLFQYADDPATAFELLKDGADDVRGAAGDDRDAGDFEIAQPAEARQARNVPACCGPWHRSCGSWRMPTRRRSSRRRTGTARTSASGCHGWRGRARRRMSATSSAKRGRSTQENRSPSSGIWMDGELAGCIGCHVVDYENRNCSIGYWLDAARQGQGIMTRCCTVLLDYLFGELQVHRVEIRAATGNVRSCAIPERLGFTREGIAREAQWVGERWLDMVIWSMLEAEWRARVR